MKTEELNLPSVFDIPCDVWAKAYPLREQMREIKRVCNVEDREPTASEVREFADIERRIRAAANGEEFNRRLKLKTRLARLKLR
jgi:hypothetical protein